MLITQCGPIGLSIILPRTEKFEYKVAVRCPLSYLGTTFHFQAPPIAWENSSSEPLRSEWPVAARHIIIFEGCTELPTKFRPYMHVVYYLGDVISSSPTLVSCSQCPPYTQLSLFPLACRILLIIYAIHL